MTTTKHGVKTSLLMAKSRVAPIKTLTVPVLKLNGALLLSELLQHITSSLAIKVQRVCCWTNSTITLAWLRKHPSTWKIVIANRVSKIQTALPTAIWRVNSPELVNKCSELGVKWRFNPPSAPHFGGMQEAGVKSMKYHLKRVIGEFTPTSEEMQTLLCKIEASLNSRPIAPLSDNADDYSVLTPGHFITGGPLNALPRESVEAEKITRLSRWKVLQKFHEQLWRIWSREYLLHLQQRYKWQTTQAQLQQGDLVLVQNPILPPNQWDMGRVTKVHPGDDNKVRVVEVKTAKGTYTRPITRMCKLPVKKRPREFDQPVGITEGPT
ncbi:uncharacterized protein LOC108631692 [Ceratina calcarata]|uniref:Uncharacterized protein LOC108631692 n=1 Tax=Ceratina calcarata TaxID=156304 RepID=A0AAJ7JEZ5_9HYME|nr:uncharacterized protein LOC108631692 [Ceratina calcarata]